MEQHAKSFSELEASYEKAGRVEELVKLYEAQVRQVAQPEAGRLYAKAADLVRERLKNAGRAEELYRRAMLNDPRSADALKGLKALYEAKNDFLNLAETLEKLASLSSGQDAAALWTRAADLWEQKLTRKDRTILALQQATRAFPRERANFKRVRALLLGDHRYQTAFDSLERERAALGNAQLAEEYVDFAERLIDDPYEHALASKALHVAAALEKDNPRTDKAQKALQKFEHAWRDRVRTLRTQSADERNPRQAAYLSLLVAKLFAWYDAGAQAKIKEALDRCFLLWPAMPDALLLLERISEKAGDVTPAVVLFEKMAAEAQERTTQVELWVRAASVKLSRLNDAPGALAALKKATAADPSRADAAGLCAELLLDSGNAAEAVKVLEAHLASLKDRHAQVALRLRLADLCLTLLQDRAGARAHLEAALEKDPLHALAAYQLARLSVEDEDRETAGALLDVALRAPKPLADRVTLCEAAAVLCDEADDARGAFQVLSQALMLQPTRPLLIDSLTEQAKKAKAIPELAALLKRAAGAEPDPRVQGELRERASRLLAEEGEVDEELEVDAQPPQAVAPAVPAPAAPGAPLSPVQQLEEDAKRLELSAADASILIQVYRRIVQLDPKNVSALKRLGATVATLGQWEEVATVTAQLAEVTAGEERAEWRSRLAQLYSERLNKKDEAAQIFLSLLEEGTATAAVVTGLERLSSQGSARGGIARALAEHYGRIGDRQRQVSSLLVQLSTAQTREEQKELLSLLALAQENHLADSAAALESRQRGMAIDPADELFRSEAIRLARDLKSHAELSRFLFELAQKPTTDAKVAAELLQDAAELADEGGAIEEATRALQLGHQKSPDDPAILGRLTQLFLKAGRREDAEQSIRRQILVTDGSAKIPLYLNLCALSLELGRPRDAAGALEEALKLGAPELELFPRLCDLYERAARMSELTNALGRYIAAAERAGKKDLAEQLTGRRVRVLEASMGDKAEAVKNYSAVLEKRPSDPDALAALELLLADPQNREEAARALIPAYESVKEHRKQVAALGVLAKAVSDPLEKVLALKQAAYVQLHHLRQPDQAFAALAEALTLAPHDGSIRAAARQAAEDGDAVDLFVEVVGELVEKQLPPATAIALHRELADAWERKLDNRAKAIAHLRAVLALEPKHLETLKALHRLHRAGEEWADLSELAERLAALATEPAEKIALWREAALLHEQKLSDPESAAAAWREVAERDPLDRAAALALDRLFTATDKPQDLAFALELRRAQEGQSPQGRELTFRLATLRQQKLADEAGALQLYRQLLTEDADHLGAREALEAIAKGTGPESATALEILDPLLLQVGDHPRRIALREARLDAAMTDEKARLLAQIRAIYERDLNQPDRAFLAAVKAFAQGLDPEGTRADLERLARATNAFEDLADIYEDAAGKLMPGDGRSVVYLRRAAELREQLGQAEEAVRLWRAVVAESPQDRAALDNLGRLYEKSQSAKNLSEIYARKAQLATDPSERLENLVKSGEAFEASGEDAQAIDAFKAALAIQRAPDALRALDRLYAKAHRAEELADVLRQLAELATGEEQRALLARRAQLLEKHGALTEATLAYGELLAKVPTDAAALGGLERLLQQDAVKQEAARLIEPALRSANDQKKLVEVLEIRLPTVLPEQRLATLNELASLREAIGQKPLAFAARLRAFIESPGDEATRDHLERLAADTGAFEELAGAYEDQQERGGEPALQLELSRRLAALYGDRLARPDLAAKWLEEVLKRDPKNVQALETLGRIHRAHNAWRELASVLKRQVNLAPNAQAQIELLFELAQVADGRLTDKLMAAQCYIAILDRKADDPNAIKALAKVLAESERWSELAALIVKEIALADGKGAKEEANELRVRLGRLKLVKLNDHRGALELFADVLQRRAQHPGAVGALEEMSRSESPLRGEAAQMLEPVFATGGDYAKLVSVYESRASSEKSPVDRAAFLRKAAEIYANHLGEPETAFLKATKALEEAPEDGRSLQLCLQLARPAEMEEAFAEFLVGIAQKVVDDSARAVVYRTLAKLQEQQQQPEQAAASWRKVLELNGSDPEALSAMGQLLAKSGKPQDLAAVLQKQLAMADAPEVRAELLLELGILQEDRLKDGNAALGTFRRLLELRPNDATALERMEWLCQRQERWPELADVLGRRLTLVKEDEGQDLRYRLAQVREAKLLDKLGAQELYAQILAIDPRHEGAIAALEQVLEAEPQHQPVADVLHAAFRASGDDAKLAAFLEARSNVLPGYQRKDLYLELAQLRARHGEAELAYLALYRAFKDDPNDAALREKLEQASDAAQTFAELAGAYEEELPRLGEEQDLGLVCLKLGWLYDQKLDEADKAVEYYERARAHAPTLAPRVLPALDRLYTEGGVASKLPEVLRAQVALCEDKAEKVSLLFRVGQLHQEKLQQPDEAAAAYEELLALEPGHLASARLLEQLFEAAGNQQKLYKILEHQRDRTQGTERERILSRMAQVSAEGLSDLSHSIELYRELLSKNPKNEQAFVALENLLERAGRHDELKALLEGKLAKTVDPRELVRLNDRIGRVLFRALKQPEAAIPFFKAALERDARHKGALESLRDIHEQLGKKDELVAVLRRLVPLQESAEGVKAIRVKLAEALAELGRREEALDSARRSLEVEPHAIAELERLNALYTRLRAYGDAVKVMELCADEHLKAQDKDQAVATLFQVVDLWLGPASKPEGAGPVLEKILEHDPANRRAYEMACDLYTRHNDWRAYASRVDRYIPNLVTDEEKLAALQDLAKVQEQKLNQKSFAFMALCRAVELSPQNDTIREEVERLASESGQYDALCDVYEGIADGLPRGPLAERLYLTLARLQDQHLDNAPGAEAALRKILEFDPTNALALDALAGMFSRRNQTKEYVVALEQKLETAGSIEQRKGILKEIARVYDETVQNPQEAAHSLLRALELEPDMETLRALVNLYRRTQQFAEVASTLIRGRELASTQEERAQLQIEIAQVQEREIQNDEAAIEAYRTALEFDPSAREALDSLERLYTKLDRPADLLQVYQRQSEVTQDYRERVKVLFKSASIWEDKYHNLENADACVAGVLQIEPANLQALVNLQRLRREQGRWEELAQVIEAHLQIATSVQEQANLLVQLGELYQQNLKQPDRAVDSFNRAIQVDPQCRPALHALGMLYERSGNWPDALQMLSLEVAAAGATPEAVELHFRMGKINEDMFQDHPAARAAYEAALAIDGGYLPAIRALKTIHESSKDWGSYESTLISEAERTEDPEAKSKACIEVAKFFADQKQDREQSTHWYEEAIRLAPDAVEAARPLADVYTAAEDWVRGERMLDIVVAKMSDQLSNDQDGSVSRELCRQLYRLGYVAQKQGKQDKALAAWERAYQLDATYLPALESYGNLLVEVRRFEEALKIYQSILIHHGTTLTNIEKVDTYFRLGEIHLGLKQHDRAANHYQKALAIDSGHEPSLRAVIALADAAGQIDRAVEYRQSLAAVVDGEARFTVLLELGQLAKEKLNDPHLAIEALQAAHKLNPQALEVMDALYILFRQTRQGQKAAEVLERMLQVDELKGEPERAKRVWYALGEIRRDELKEVDSAALAFNAALDLDPRFVDAFSALEAMLGGAKQWKPLEENYARMIQRLPKTEDTHAARMLLWRALGDLYLKVLKHPEGALMAYQVVAAGLPDDGKAQETYAELAATVPGNEEKAVAAYRRALVSSSTPNKVVAALAELCAKRKDYDGAYLAAQVAHGFLGSANDGEKEILTKLGPYARKREVAQRPLNDRLWQTHLFHPKLRTPLAELMAILFEQVGHHYAAPMQHYQVNPRKHRIDVQSAQEFQLHHYRYASKLLGMDAVELYSPFLVATREKLAKKSSDPAPEPMVGLEILHTHPVALKVGGRYFGEPGQKEIYYLLGRTLALLRSELALSQRVSPERLDALLQAAVSLSVSTFRITADLRLVEEARKLLEKTLPEPVKATLARAVREYMKVARAGDLQGYLEGCELTAARCGLFVAGELEAVKKLLMTETGAAFRVNTRTKLHDLLVFALSEDLAALRVAVGTNVEIAARR